MLVVFAGGGTGGHIYPGVAVARALQSADPSIEFEFWGSGRSLETEIFGKESLKHRTLPSAPLPKNPLALLKFLWSVPAGFAASRRLLRELRVAAVVGLGGFSSYAPVRTAVSLGLPAFLLEQNAVPGNANIRLARRASLTCLSWEASGNRLRGAATEVTGNPLRKNIVDAAAGAAYDPSAGILIFGGSTGAVGLNNLVVGAAKALGSLGRPITHQTGSQDFQRVQSAYRDARIQARVLPYIDDMSSAYRSAALVIARAGGTTLSELALFGLPSILIPYPHHKDYHQMENARIFLRAGAAAVIEEKKNTSADLASSVSSLIADAPALLKMHHAARGLARPDAAETVASRILASIHSGSVKGRLER